MQTTTSCCAFDGSRRAFPVRRRLVRRRRARAARGRRRRSRIEARRMPRPRRRVRLRQVDRRLVDRRPAGADRGAASCSTGMTVDERQRAVDRKVMARVAQIVFQDPYASLNPRQTVRRTLEDPLRLHGVDGEKRGRRSRREDAGAGRPAPRARGPLSARILRRPAPAHRHRAGADPEPEDRHLRRAGVGARRVDPRPDHQSAAGAEGDARACPTS